MFSSPQCDGFTVFRVVYFLVWFRLLIQAIQDSLVNSDSHLSPLTNPRQQTFRNPDCQNDTPMIANPPAGKPTIDIDKWPAGVYADPRTVSGRAAWYSFAFLIRIAAATQLDVDIQELQAGIRTIEFEDIPRGQAFLSDNLENGTGYCRWLGDGDNLRLLLSACCDLKTGQIAAKWVNNEHFSTCDTSCSHCLRDFYNMQYHGLLDWRLALDMARIAMESSTSCNLINPFTESCGSLWRPLFDNENAPITKTLAQFGYSPIDYNPVPNYISLKRKKALVGYHPLWTKKHSSYKKAVQSIKVAHPDFEIEALNLFIAMRRPSDFI